MNLNEPVGGAANRRRCARRLFRSNAQPSIAGADPITERTLDISGGGIGLVAEANPPAAQRLPDPHPANLLDTTVFALEARVAHSVPSSADHGFRIGLEFTRLTPASARAIEKFVKS